MRATKPWRFWFIFSVALGAAWIGPRILVRHSGRDDAQAERMRLAKAHVPAAKQALAKHPDLAAFSVREFSGEGGTLAIIGPFESEAQLNQLKEIVAATNPPVPVTYLRMIDQLPPAASPSPNAR